MRLLSPLRRWVALSLGLLMLPCQMLPGWTKTDWYMLKANGKPIGQIRIDHYKDRQAHVTEISNVNRFQRDGSPFEVNTTSRFEEDSASGAPRAFSYQYQLGEQHMLEAQGQVQGEQLNVQVVRNSQPMAGQAPLNKEQFLFPGGPGLEKVYKAHAHDAPGSRFHYQTINLGISPAVVQNEVTLLGTETLALAAVGEKSLRKFAVRNPAGQESATYEWRDENGKLYLAQAPDTGMEMVYASRRQVRGMDTATVDLVTSTQVLTNVIPQPRVTYEALYKIAPLTGQQVNLQAAFPEDDTQEIVEGGVAGLTRATPNELYLKVVPREPADVSVTYPIRYDQAYLQATPFMQTTDAAIERTAADVISGEKRAYYAARKLRHWVYQNVVNKNLGLGFASAKETILNREGDCTEHAVLLAAMARSVGIPSRVAVGLIYQPDANTNLGHFVYHMWTEVYIGSMDKGQWIPLDATNPEDMADATHIKIADSALTNVDELLSLTQKVVSVMGRIRIDVLKALSPAQSVLTIGKQPGVLNAEITHMDIQHVDLKKMSRKAIKHYRVDMPPEALSLEKPEGLFTYGVEQLSKDRYDAAVDAFQKALSKLRRPIEFYRMGERLAAIEMYDLARQAFGRASQSDGTLAPFANGWLQGYVPSVTLPDALNRLFMRGLSLQVDKRDYAGAEEAYRQVTAQAPGFAPAWLHLGEVLTGQEAKMAFQRAAAVAPNDFRNYESLGDMLLEDHHPAEAAKAYRQAVEVLNNQTFAYGKTWRDDARGKQYLANGTALLARNSRSAAGWMETGKGLMLQNRLEDAAKAFGNALILNPGSMEALEYRAYTALRNSEWVWFQQHLPKLTAAAGGNAMAARVLGMYQMRTREYDAAVQTLQRAISLAPGHPDGYSTLSRVYLRYADQVEASPTLVKGVNAQAMRSRAETVLKNGIPRLSSEWDKRLLELQLAEVLLAHGKGTEAHTYAQSALVRNPLDPRAYLLKGKAQFYQGESGLARETLEVARLLNPNDAEVLLQLGQLAMEEGREPVALDFYQRAYRVDPLNPSVANTLRDAMTRLKVAGRKPPAYWALSADEHDYLVQLLVMAKAMKLNLIQCFRYVNELGEGGKLGFTVAGLERGRSAGLTFSQIYDKELGYFNRLKRMNIPSRFAGLHHGIQQVAYARLALYALLAENAPRVLSASETQQFIQSLSERMAASSTAESQASKALLGVSSQLPESIFTALLYESQMDNLAALNQELNDLMVAIGARNKGGEKQNATTGQQATTANPGTPSTTGSP